MALPPDRFLNLVYFYAVDGADPKDRQRFDAKLHMPPPEVRRAARISDASPWSKANEEAALSGLAAAIAGGG